MKRLSRTVRERRRRRRLYIREVVVRLVLVSLAWWLGQRCAARSLEEVSGALASCGDALARARCGLVAAADALDGRWPAPAKGSDVYGDGRAAERIVAAILGASGG